MTDLITRVLRNFESFHFVTVRVTHLGPKWVFVTLEDFRSAHIGMLTAHALTVLVHDEKIRLQVEHKGEVLFDEGEADPFDYGWLDEALTNF